MNRDEFKQELYGIAASNLHQMGIDSSKYEKAELDKQILDQMAWLACLYEANNISECCTLKDLARIVRNGMPAFDLNEWLKGLDFEETDDEQDVNEILRQMRLY